MKKRIFKKRLTDISQYNRWWRRFKVNKGRRLNCYCVYISYFFLPYIDNFLLGKGFIFGSKKEAFDFIKKLTKNP